MFFSIDGGDGTGKSTQIEGFCQWLRDAGHQVVACRDPGSTPLGEAVRGMLLHRHDLHIDRRSEMLLYMAARAQLVEEVIRPALGAGQDRRRRPLPAGERRLPGLRRRAGRGDALGSRPRGHRRADARPDDGAGHAGRGGRRPDPPRARPHGAARGRLPRPRPRGISGRGRAAARDRSS